MAGATFTVRMPGRRLLKAIEFRVICEDETEAAIVLAQISNGRRIYARMNDADLTEDTEEKQASSTEKE